jgi:hypothetical protein
MSYTGWPYEPPPEGIDPMSQDKFRSKWLDWQPKHAMDEARKISEKEYDKAMQAVEHEKDLAVARDRARLSVLKLTDKDRAFLKSLKVAT